MFDTQEREKERAWDNKGQRWLGKRASWEVYWKNNQFKKGKSRGGVDSIRYTDEVIGPFLIPF
jgi:hypothetical protein